MMPIMAEFACIESRHGGFIGNVLNPGHVQRQLVANGEVLPRYGDAPTPRTRPRLETSLRLANTTDPRSARR